MFIDRLSQLFHHQHHYNHTELRLGSREFKGWSAFLTCSQLTFKNILPSLLTLICYVSPVFRQLLYVSVAMLSLPVIWCVYYFLSYEPRYSTRKISLMRISYSSKLLTLLFMIEILKTGGSMLIFPWRSLYVIMNDPRGHWCDIEKNLLKLLFESLNIRITAVSNHPWYP